MTAREVLTLTKQEFHLLRDYIQQESGITLADEKAYLLESRLKGLLSQVQCSSYGDLYRMAKDNKPSWLRVKIIDAITTNETLWFRDTGPFAILDEVFLPEMLAQISKGKH